MSHTKSIWRSGAFARVARVTVCAGLVALAGAACSAPADEEAGFTAEDVKQAAQRELDEGHEEAAAMLEDGVVTQAEYQQAVENVAECVTEGGLIMSEPVLNPIDNQRLLFTVDWNGIDGEVAEPLVTGCQTTYQGAVETYYTATNEASMDQALVPRVRECMVEEGFDVEQGAADVRAFVGPTQDEDTSRRDVAVECISTAVREVFPDLPNVSIAF